MSTFDLTQEFSENLEGVHLMSPLNREFSMCGDAFDAGGSGDNPDGNLEDTEKRVVTCKKVCRRYPVLQGGKNIEGGSLIMKRQQPTREPTLTFAIVTGEGETERILGEFCERLWAERTLLQFKQMGVYPDARIRIMPLEDATKWVRAQIAAVELSKSDTILK